MKPISRFGICAERFARFGAPLKLWQRASDDEFASVQPLLTSTNEMATTWVPPNPAHPRMRVIDLGSGRYRAVCDDDMSEPIDLTRPDLVHWRADEKRLRKNLCDTLGLIVARDDLRRLPGLLRIGEWRFSPSTGCPVWLACAPTGMALAEHFRQAAVISSCPSIVLLLTRSAWGIEAERYAPKNRFLVATLDEAISLNENGWVEAADWDERLGGFTEAAGISVSGGFRAKKKNEKLAQAGATAAKLKAELRQRFRSAKKKLLDTGVLLPAPEVQEIAWACGVHPSTAGRWLKGEYKERDKELALLWKHIGDREYIRSYRE